MKFILNKNTITQTLTIVGVFSGSLIFLLAAARLISAAPPTQAPPGGNVPPPINMGAPGVTQNILGGLDIHEALTVDGDLNLGGQLTATQGLNAQDLQVQQITVNGIQAEPLQVKNNGYYFFVGANRGGGDYVDIGAYHTTAGWKNLILNRDGGNVGIGTASPDYRLTVMSAGAGNAPLVVRRNATSVIGFLAEDASRHGYLLLRDASNADIVKLNTRGDSYFNGGNVGIGYTTPNPRLMVVGSGATPPGSGNTNDTVAIYAKTSAGSGSGLYVQQDGTDYAAFFRGKVKVEGPLEFVGAGGGITGVGSDKSIAFWRGTPPALDADPNFVFDYTNGKLGIGTASPDKKLEVQGGGLLVESASGIANTNPFVSMAATDYSAAQGTFRFEDLRATQTSPSFVWNVTDNSGAVIAYDFQRGGTSALSITQDGDVNIAGALTLGTDLAISQGGTGASDAATARMNLGLRGLAILDAVGGGIGGTITDETVTDADVSASAAIAGTKISPDFGTQNIVTTGTINTGQGATEVYLMDQAVRTTDTPQFAKLGIGRAATGYGIDVNGNIQADNGISFGGTASGIVEGIGRTAANTLGLFSGSTQRVTIDGSGNVGIGHTAPNNKLHVRGRNTADDGLDGGGVNTAVGIYADDDAPDTGLYAQQNNPNGWAALFSGNVRIDKGNLSMTSGKPKLLTTYQDSGFADGTGIAISGKFAYVISDGSGTDQFIVVDISNPSTPFIIATVSISNPSDIHVSGKYAYVVSFASNLFYVINVSNPASPFIESSIGMSRASAVYTYGKYVYVGAYVNSDYALAIVDISDPTNPVIVGVADLTSVPLYDNLINEIYVSRNYAYLTKGAASAFQVVDITNPRNPVEVASVQSRTYLSYADIYVSGRYAYIASFLADKLTIYSVADPNNPTLVSSNLVNDAYDVRVSGKYAYITTRNVTKDLEIWDISDPFSPFKVGAVSNAGLCMAMSGKYLYTVCEDRTPDFDVIDVSGIDVPTANMGDLDVSNVNISENLDVGSRASFGGGLHVGSGGLLIDSDLTARGNSYFGGNVGIAQAAPGAKLTVNNPTTAGKIGNAGDAIYAYANSTNAAISAEQKNASGWAGYFSGRVKITGGLELANGTTLSGVGSTAGTAAEGNKQISVTAGSGLAGGGAITIGTGGNIDLNIGAGNGILVNVDNITVDPSVVPQKTGDQIVSGKWTFGDNATFDKDVLIKGKLTVIDKITNVTVESVTVQGSIIPGVDNLSDLGSPIQRWKDGYFGNNVIIGGNISIAGTVDGVDISSNAPSWNAAYDERRQWDGGSTNLNAATGRTSLGLGALATLNEVDSTQITDNSITNTDINASAAIAGTKISPDFGTQNIITTGRIGLGVPSPTEPLDVLGNANVRGTLRLRTGGNLGNLNIFDPGSGTATIDNAGNARLNITSNTWINLTGRVGIGFTDIPSGTQLAVNGNVGIGTASPVARLSIDTPGEAGNVLAIRGNSNKTILSAEQQGSGGAGYFKGGDLVTVDGALSVWYSENWESGLAIYPTSPSDAQGQGHARFWVYEGTPANRWYIATLGKNFDTSMTRGSSGARFSARGIYADEAIGIGTIGDLDTYKLNVNGKANAIELCINGDCKASWGAVTGTWGVSGADIYNLNTGNVGIGTATPQAKLHVAGSVLFEGGSGDVSGDGRTTSADSLAITQYLSLSIRRSLTPAQMALADVDGDGRVTDDDSSVISAMLVGVTKEEALRVVHSGYQVSCPGGYISGLCSKRQFNVWDGNLSINPSLQIANARLAIDTAGSVGDGIAVAVNSANSAIYAEQQGSGYAGYFSGTSIFMGNVGIGTAAPAEKFNLTGGNFLQTISTDPIIKGSIGVPQLANPSSVYVSGKYAYVTDPGADTLAIVDVSNPGSPSVVGSVPASPRLNRANAVYVSGKYAYVTSGGSGSLDSFVIVDISNPFSPFIVGYIENSSLLDYAQSVYVSGKYAYVIASGPGSTRRLNVIDVSNPAFPAIVGFVSDTELLGIYASVYVSGKYAYVATTDFDTLTIVDISNPSSPTIAGFKTDGTQLNGPAGVYVSGRYAYVASANLAGLTIIDVANPSSPVIVGLVSDVRLNGARGVYVAGKYAYIASESADTLTIVDISNPSFPTIVGSKSDVLLNGARSVYVSGKYAYVTAPAAGSLTIVDISGLEVPSAHIGDISASTIEVSENVDIGNNLYVRNGLNVGLGGLLSDGAVSITPNAITTTALTITQRGTGDLLNLFDDTIEVFTVLDGGNVGIGTVTPQSALQIGTGKYLQLDTSSDSPPPADCDTANETGRMMFSTSGNRLYVCTGVGGWEWIPTQR